MGHWYGKYFQAKHDEPLAAFKEAMELFTLGNTEYSFEQAQRNLSVSLIGERLTSGYIEVFCVFMEELMQVLGYKAKDKEIRKGLLRMSFTR